MSDLVAEVEVSDLRNHLDRYIARLVVISMYMHYFVCRLDFIVLFVDLTWNGTGWPP